MSRATFSHRIIGGDGRQRDDIAVNELFGNFCWQVHFLLEFHLVDDIFSVFEILYGYVFYLNRFIRPKRPVKHQHLGEKNDRD